MIGLGLRDALSGALCTRSSSLVQFLEISPENWIGVGGKPGKELKALSERYPFIGHGLNLSLGGCDPLNLRFLKEVKRFLRTHRIPYYSEHLSFTGHGGQLYKLFPLPFTDEAVRHVSKRIRRVQEILEVPLAVENIAYYLSPEPQEMAEIEFVRAVLEEADCRLLLDVSNLYVNSVNHGYDPLHFLGLIPMHRIAYLHVAGYRQASKRLLIDTHGEDVAAPAWKLLKAAYRRHGVLPTLLERDRNIPVFRILIKELERIRRLQASCAFL